MCLFIETIRIDHGRVCNLSRHNRRLNDTRAHFWPESTPLQLSDYLSSPGCGAGITGAGIVKARVVYGEKGIEDVSYSPYTVRHVHSLALIQADHIDYTYKSAGREPLNRLFALRGACDDILIVKQGLLLALPFHQYYHQQISLDTCLLLVCLVLHPLRLSTVIALPAIRHLF